MTFIDFHKRLNKQRAAEGLPPIGVLAAARRAKQHIDAAQNSETLGPKYKPRVAKVLEGMGVLLEGIGDKKPKEPAKATGHSEASEQSA